jgi:hypothetical protein
MTTGPSGGALGARAVARPEVGRERGTEFADYPPALKVICPRCRQEGKPCLLVTIETPGDDRELQGLCWTHRLQLLATSGQSPASREPGKR